MISFGMSEEQELIRDTLREFANEAMRSIARDCDETAQIPQDFLDSVWENMQLFDLLVLRVNLLIFSRQLFLQDGYQRFQW